MRLRRALFFPPLAVLALASAGCARHAPPAPPPVPAGQVDDARLVAAEGNAEWLVDGRSHSGQRFSPLDAINRANVAALGLAWYHEFDAADDRGMEATPLVVDGVLYVPSSQSRVHAFDARTGRLLWSHDARVDHQQAQDACCNVVNRGVAVWEGRVYAVAPDGRLIALDAATGREIWSQQIADPALPHTITGAPRVAKGRVLVGQGGAGFGVRGQVSAYDAATGAPAWRFFMTPNPDGRPDGAASDALFAAKAASTGSAGGGTVCGAITYDPRTGLAYVGVGNGSPSSPPQRSAGEGDGPLLSSIVALRADTGEYAWHYQATPGDRQGSAPAQPIVTADLVLGGRERHVVMQARQDGFFQVLDAATGEPLAADRFLPVNRAPHLGSVTGHDLPPAAFHPADGLVFIPAIRPGSGDNGDPGQLVAWDPVARRQRWIAEHAGERFGGVLATAGGLVFAGAGPSFNAWDSATGRLLWSDRTAAAVMAGAATYAIDGEQYVAVTLGDRAASASPGGRYLRRPGRLHVYRLGGAAQAPGQVVTTSPAGVAVAVTRY